MRFLGALKLIFGLIVVGILMMIADKHPADYI